MDRLVVGIVRTSHGIKGYVKAKSLSGEKEHFFRMEKVLLKKDNREKEYRIEEVKSQADGLLIKFEGIDTPEDGKKLAGAEIWVDRTYAVPLEKDEYYAADIVGSDIIYEGRKVAKVISVIEGGAADLLEVGDETGVHLIPVNDQFIGTIDIERREIQLKDDWVLR